MKNNMAAEKPQDGALLERAAKHAMIKCNVKPDGELLARSLILEAFEYARASVPDNAGKAAGLRMAADEAEKSKGGIIWNNCSYFLANKFRALADQLEGKCKI